jgi:hypothetical protein
MIIQYKTVKLLVNEPYNPRTRVFEAVWQPAVAEVITLEPGEAMAFTNERCMPSREPKSLMRQDIRVVNWPLKCACGESRSHSLKRLDRAAARAQKREFLASLAE